MRQGNARGLQALRNALGTAFSAGILLNTGQLAYNLDDRIHVAPVDAHWTQHHSSRGRSGTSTAPRSSQSAVRNRWIRARNGSMSSTPSRDSAVDALC